MLTIMMWMTIMMKMIMMLTMLMLMVPSKKPTNRVLFISVIPPRCCSHSHYWQTTIRKKQLGTIPNILEVGVDILHLQNTHIIVALMTVRKNVQPYPTFWKYISVDTLQNTHVTDTLIRTNNKNEKHTKYSGRHIELAKCI